MPISTLPNPRRNIDPRASNFAGQMPAVRINPACEADSLEQIVSGCQRGDRQAQRLLFERCHERVFRLAVRMVGRQDAADVLQQTFLRIFSKIEQFSGAARFETWLCRVAVNECLQHRRRKKHVHYPMPAEDPADHRPEHTLRALQQELMERALAQLPVELRAVFVLKEVEGLSYHEIAATLKIKEGTVGSRLNEARAQLRTVLGELGWKPDA